MTPFEQSSPPHKTTRNQVNLGMMDVSGAVESLPGMTGYFSRSEPVSATGTEGTESFVTSMVTSAGVKSSVRESFTVIKPALKAVSDRKSKNETSLVSQGKTRLFDSRSDRIRTYDPLVPNQVR